MIALFLAAIFVGFNLAIGTQPQLIVVKAGFWYIIYNLSACSLFWMFCVLIIISGSHKKDEETVQKVAQLICISGIKTITTCLAGYLLWKSAPLTVQNWNEFDVYRLIAAGFLVIISFFIKMRITGKSYKLNL